MPFIIPIISQGSKSVGCDCTYYVCIVKFPLRRAINLQMFVLTGTSQKRDTTSRTGSEDYLLCESSNVDTGLKEIVEHDQNIVTMKTTRSEAVDQSPVAVDSPVGDNPVDNPVVVDETPRSSGPGNVVVVDSSAGGVGIISRMTNIPVVSSTIGQVSNMYTWTKESSSLANKALGYAEKSVVIAAQTAKPVVDRLEKPITMASDFACQQLDKLEEKVPLISKPTDEVMSTIQDGTWQVIEGTKQRGTDGLTRLMNTKVGQVVTLGLDTALSVSEYAVDYCLPADETEKKPEFKEDYDEKDEMELVEKPTPAASSVARVGILTNKLRHRIHQRAINNVRYAQKRSQETIEKLHFTVDLIDYAKNTIDGANQTIRTNASAAQEKLWNSWNDWTTTEEGEEKNEEDPEVKDKEGEQKTLAIARQLARRLHGITENLASSITSLPQQIRGKVEETRALADSVYHSFEEAHYISDISIGVLNRCREQLDNLSHATMQVADYIINTTPIQWLIPDEIPNIEMDGVELDYMPGSDQNDVDLTSEF